MSYTIPTGRTVISGWSANITVGVTGGLDRFNSRIEYEVTGLALDGSADCRPLIQAAIDSASPNTVVKIPSGIIRLDNSLNFGSLNSKKSITLRGSVDAYGRPATKVYPANYVIGMGSTSDYEWSYPAGITILNSPNAGATKITLSDSSAFSNNKIIHITVNNNTGIPVIGVNPAASGQDRLQVQKTYITNKVGDTFDIFPPLYWDLPSGRNPKVALAQFNGYENGVENLDIIATGTSYSQGMVLMDQCYCCWIKNVNVSGFNSTAIGISDSLFCEIRRCDLRIESPSAGTNKHGLLFNGTSSACLIEDNIIINIAPSIQLFGPSSANVFAYNFLFAPNFCLNLHNTHPCYNLYEGNYASQYHADGFFGSASHETLYRNWFHGQITPTGLSTYSFGANRFNRILNIVGNYFGTSGITNVAELSFGNPNLGNSNFSGYASLINGTPWYDLNTGTNQGKIWKGYLLARGAPNPGQPEFFSSGVISGSIETIADIREHCLRSLPSADGSIMINYFTGQVINRVYVPYFTSGSTSGIITVTDASVNLPVPSGQLVLMTPGPQGFQESDLDVSGTALVMGNYRVPNGIDPPENLNGSGLASSLFRSTKPDYFYSLDWPVVNPEAGQPSSFALLPAGYRYLNNGIDPGSGASPDGPTYSLSRSQFVRQQIMLMSRRR